MGEFNQSSGQYPHINYENINRSIQQSRAMLKRWGKHPAFGAFEPVNEPWWSTPEEELKDFYRQVRYMMLYYAPDATFVMHDSFKYDMSLWDDVFENKENVAIDHHFYQAWWVN